MAHWKLADLGFLTKESKSSLKSETGTSRIQHWYCIYDAKDFEQEIQEVSKLVNTGTCTTRQLSSFIGNAILMTVAVFLAQLKVQHLMVDKIGTIQELPWKSHPKV
ncbi:hypothetical protein BGX20_009894 [Mortierella sp. AD010]|nr:hypothetical protein BGX20_009894 [Mortierella sp. AD010]